MVQWLKKKSNFRFSAVVYQQKMQFFVMLSLKHVVDKLKKIIQFGKKSWTNMSFHYILPSPSTALDLRKLEINQ